MTRLTMLSALWCNDDPNGLGVTFTDAKFLAFFQPILAEFIYKSAGTRSEVMLEQLSVFGRKKASGLTEAEKCLIVMNIAALQHRGDIPNDDYNGIVAITEFNPDGGE